MTHLLNQADLVAVMHCKLDTFCEHMNEREYEDAETILLEMDGVLALLGGCVERARANRAESRLKHALKRLNDSWHQDQGGHQGH